MALSVKGPSLMGATIEALHRLQEIELQIAEIRRGIERKARQCRRQEKLITDIDAEIRAQRDQLHTAQKDADALDLQAKSGEEEINKYRSALNTSKTNKEYSAVLTQLNTLKADNSKVEERVLTLLSAIDEKKKKIQEIEADREKEEEKLTSFRDAARQVEEKSRDRLTRLQAERDRASEAVPAKVLEMFERVAGKNDGEAMAMVVRTHPKRQEYACDGCNMSITIEQVNTILSRDEAVLCNVCGRILYHESPTTSNVR